MTSTEIPLAIGLCALIVKATVAPRDLLALAKRETDEKPGEVTPPKTTSKRAKK